MDINMYLTKHFQLKEFIINNEKYFLSLTVNEQNVFIARFKVIAKKLEVIRAYIGSIPISISSGFRSPSYNTYVRGKPKSFHLLGCAVDITFQSISVSQMEKMKTLFNGVIWYPNQLFYHLDIRDKSIYGIWYDIDYS